MDELETAVVSVLVEKVRMGGGLGGVSGGGAGSVSVTRNILREKRTYPEGSALSKSVLFCQPSSRLMLGPFGRSFIGMLLLR